MPADQRSLAAIIDRTSTRALRLNNPAKIAGQGKHDTLVRESPKIDRASAISPAPALRSRRPLRWFLAREEAIKAAGEDRHRIWRTCSRPGSRLGPRPAPVYQARLH